MFVFALILTPVSALAECVVLLHGLARTEVSFAVMEAALDLEGYQTVSPNYASTKAPIPTLAEDTLPGAIARCESTPIHFVTHSLGGILLRVYLQNNEIPDLGRSVLLGPPNHGSELVNTLGDLALFEAFNGPAGMQLGTDSFTDSLSPLNFDAAVIAGTRSLNPYFSSLIDGPDDGKVSVASTRVDGMRMHLTMPVTHTFMMNNPRVITETLRFLEDGYFEERDDLGEELWVAPNE